MLSLSAILPECARTRYDEEGEPKYTAPERVLKAMRLMDWAGVSEIHAAIEGMPSRDVSQALTRLVRAGKVLRRQLPGKWSVFKLNEKAFVGPARVAKRGTSGSRRRS